GRCTSWPRRTGARRSCRWPPSTSSTAGRPCSCRPRVHVLPWPRVLLDGVGSSPTAPGYAIRPPAVEASLAGPVLLSFFLPCFPCLPWFLSSSGGIDRGADLATLLGRGGAPSPPPWPGVRPAMLFCSPEFVLFFALVFVAYWALPGRWARAVLL